MARQVSGDQSRSCTAFKPCIVINRALLFKQRPNEAKERARKEKEQLEEQEKTLGPKDKEEKERGMKNGRHRRRRIKKKKRKSPVNRKWKDVEAAGDATGRRVDEAAQMSSSWRTGNLISYSSSAS